MFKINWKLLPVLVAFGAVNSVYAQAEKLDLSVTNKSLKQFITQVEKETDYTFMLDQTVDQNQKITVKGQQESLETILTKAFAGKPVTFEIVGKQIILKLPRTTQSGQTKKITGTIKDENGEAVIGANVSVKGTTTGTITDIDGNFSLEAQQGATLLISYIGYETQEITVGSQSVYSIRLSEDSQALDEVVVIGYGTQNRQAITGSITKADIDTYRDVPTNNIMETIKGSVPGLNVGGVNKAGNVAGFSIRGQNSTRDGGNNPLIVLDGAIYDGSLADIPSEDIENFTVLKDASAAAVYGSRSANGVILIQTKRGRSKSSKPEFNVNLSYGISNELKRLKVYDAPGYLQHILDVRQANGLDADPAKIDLYLQAEESKNYNATPDHQPTFSDPYELFRQNAYNLKANVSVSNSSEFASYYISAAMTDQKGVVLNDRYKNFSGRVNIDSNLTSWLKVGVKTNYSIRDYSGSTPSMEKAAQFSPYASLYDEEGRYLQFPQTTTSFQSPFWSMRTDDTEKYNILGAILNGKITVPWVKGLTYEMVYSNTLRWSQKNYFYDEYTTEGQGKNGKGERKNENNYSMLLDNMIKYNNTFNQKQFPYLQPIITQYFIDNKSEIWLLFLIAHSKR